MIKSPASLRLETQFGRRLASVAAALLVAGCATKTETYRVEAEIADLLGFPLGATATRSEMDWTIERRIYAYGLTRRVRLSREESLALDAALADPSLYAKPTPLKDGCLDPPTISVDVIAGGASRRLFLECETAPGLQAVLGILFE